MREDAYKDYAWNTWSREIQEPGYYVIDLCQQRSVVFVHENHTVTGTHLPMNSLKGLNMNLRTHKGVWKKMDP